MKLTFRRINCANCRQDFDVPLRKGRYPKHCPVCREQAARPAEKAADGTSSVQGGQGRGRRGAAPKGPMPSESQRQCIIYFAGGSLPRVKVTEATYGACRRNGWITQSGDVFPFHVSTEKGLLAIGALPGQYPRKALTVIQPEAAPCNAQEKEEETEKTSVTTDAKRRKAEQRVDHLMMMLRSRGNSIQQQKDLN